MSAQAQADPGIAETLVSAVRTHGKPALPAKLKRKGLPARTVSEILEQLAAGGRLYRWPKGKTTAYWHSPPESFAADAALSLASARAMDPAKLAAATSKACFGRVSPKVCAGIIAGLVRSGQLTELPGPGGPKARVVFASGRSEAYLETLADYIRVFLAKVDEPARSLAKLLGPPPEVEVLEALQRMQTGSGAHVAVRDLRRALSLDKTAFDRALLKLADEMKIELAEHDSPAAHERDDLVFEAPNKYYVAVALRN